MSILALSNEVSLVESLRPASDQEVVAAVFSTYSLDLVALLGILLGLSGIDSTEVEADRSELYRSLFKLSRKTIVLCQRGRIRSADSYRRARILSALDRIVVEAPFDERRRSWHAKIALVGYRQRTRHGEPATEWRFWLGSRNLTRSTDRDIGLLIVGTCSSRRGEHGTPSQIPGLKSALSALLMRGGKQVRAVLSAALTPKTKGHPPLETLLSALTARVSWQSSRSFKIDRVAARGDSGDLREAITPVIAVEKANLLLCAPFVNVSGLDYLRKIIPFEKASEVTLIATEDSLQQLNPAPTDVHLRMSYVSPVQQLDNGLSLPDDQLPTETPDAGEEAKDRGLHAKLLLARLGAAPARLLLGSSNLTGRGLEGGNAEAVALLRISSAQARQMSQVLVDQLSQPFVHEEIDPQVLEAREARERLEAVRRQLAVDLELSIFFDAAMTRLTSTKEPSCVPPQIELKAAPCSRIDLIQAWPRDIQSLQFQPLRSADQTEFVSLSLHDPESGEELAWIQKAEVRGVVEGFLDERDKALGAELLSLNELVRLIQAEFGGRPPERGGAWHSDHHRRGQGSVMLVFPELQLEDLLRSRARNPEEWSHEVISRVDDLLSAMIKNTDSGETEQAHEFLKIWRPFAEAFGKS